MWVDSGRLKQKSWVLDRTCVIEKTLNIYANKTTSTVGSQTSVINRDPPPPPVASPNGVSFVKHRVRQGVLGRMAEEILDTRLILKRALKSISTPGIRRRQLDSRQLGLKLIANVMYGYTAASYSGRMPCCDIADAIVMTARETLERTVRMINEHPEWNAHVVYGDTDSVFVHLPGSSRERAFNVGEAIAKAVTDANPRPVRLRFEKVYHPCVLASKKRYVGFMYESRSTREPVMDAKGIETVRRDGCRASAKILEAALKYVV